jgi:hypothetical protein
MATLNPLQWNFNGGFIGKRYRGSVGSPLYEKSLEYGLNVLINPAGKVIRRPGTEKVKKLSELGPYATTSAVGDIGSDAGRQISFKSAEEIEYRIVFDHNTIYIYSNSDSLVQTLTSTGITNTIIPSMAYDQGRDVLILCHPDMGFKTLTRGTTGTWALASLEIEDGPYEGLNLDVNVKLKPSHVDGTSRTLSAFLKDGATAINGFFAATDVGRLYRLRHSPTAGATTWGVGKVTATSSPFATATIDIPSEYEFGADAGVKNWFAGAWYDDNYPTAIGFGRNRLWALQKDRVHGSFANDFNRFSPSTENIFDDDDGHLVTDACAIDTSITNLKGEKLYWVHEDEVIHLGGENGHYTIRGSTLLGPITPSTVTINDQSSMGCANVSPISLGGLIYVHKSGKKVFAAERNFRTDRYDSIDLTVFAEDIIDRKITKLLKMTYPWSMVWCILEDGSLACLTYVKDQEIVAWSKHELATGSVIDGCVVKDINGSERLYLTIEDDAGLVFVEKMGLIPNSESVTGVDAIKVLDGGFSYGVPNLTSSTIDNLQRFEGETLYAVSNHIIVSSGVVTSGSVTFEFGTTFSGTVEIGLNYDVEFRTLPIEIKDAQNSTVGEKKQGVTVHLGLFNTGHLEVRQVGLDTWVDVPLRKVTDPSADDKNLFTGTTDQFKVPGQRVVDLQYEFRQRLPSPLCLSHLGVKLDISSV